MAVAAVAAASYLNVLPNDYCYDDVPIVRDNPLVQGPGPWWAIWQTDYWKEAQPEWANRDLLYRPVSVTSYRLVRAVAGADAWPQRAVNVALHAIGSALVVLLAGQLLLSDRAAIAAGLSFAVMPIHSEAVAGIVGRADLLVALFTTLALLANAAARSAKSRATRIVLYAATAVAAFLAAGSKESGLTVFPVLVPWDLLLTLNARPGERTRGYLPAYARIICLLVPLLIYLALRYNALGGQLVSQPQLTKTINVLVDAPPAQRALGVVQAWGMYWAKTFWPQVLNVNYSINAVRLATGLYNVHVLMGLAAALALAAVGVWAAVRRRWMIFFILAATLACYLPTSNALVLIQVFFAERTWYLPSVFVALLLGWAVQPLLAIRAGRLIGCLVLVVAAARIWDRSYDWRNNGALFAAAYAAHPEGVQPLHLYGSWLTQHGRLDEGIALLERAVTIDPGYTDAHRALSQAYLAAEKPTEAVRHTQAAEMQVPGDEATRRAHTQAVAALADANREALDQAYAAAVGNPEDLGAHLRLARLLRDIGRVEEAVQLMHAHEGRFVNSAIWHAELAVNLVLLNRMDEAVAHYRQSLDLDENAQTAAELAMLLLERRNPDDLEEADRLSSFALSLAPDAPHALVCRAEVLAQQGDLAAAQSLYRRAIDRAPPSDPRRQQFIERAKALGVRRDD